MASAGGRIENKSPRVLKRRQSPALLFLISEERLPHFTDPCTYLVLLILGERGGHKYAVKHIDLCRKDQLKLFLLARTVCKSVKPILDIRKRAVKLGKRTLRICKLQGESFGKILRLFLSPFGGFLDF